MLVISVDFLICDLTNVCNYLKNNMIYTCMILMKIVDVFNHYSSTSVL